MMNLYWPVYTKIEKEVLELADTIHFSDDQCNVYSAHIADLIVRCAVEIEAISKELYKGLGGNMNPLDSNGEYRDLYFDTDCLKLINQDWQLDKKCIYVDAANMYFEKLHILTPLHKADKRGTSGSKWKRAYQALKHDRYRFIKKATIENLITALGALFILNIYYKDERLKSVSTNLTQLEFQTECGSNVFSIDLFFATNLNWEKDAGDNCILTKPDNHLESAIYILKYRDEDYCRMHLDWCVEQRWTKYHFDNSDEINNYISQHPEMAGKSIKEICEAAGGEKLTKKIVSDYSNYQMHISQYETVLNKGLIKIYPDDPYDEEKVTTDFYKSWGLESLYKNVR